MTALSLDPATTAVLTLIAGLLMARLGLKRKMLSWRPEPRRLVVVRQRSAHRLRRP